jgi:outer membrane protein OmpA-like peptidoglycan-associated protein
MAFDAATKKPIDAKIRYEILPDGKEAGVALATAREGYKVVLSSGNRYGVRAEADGYYAINDNLDLSTLTKYEEQHHDLYLAPITVGTTIRLNNIFFETGKWDLRPESFPELDRLVQLLTGNPSLRIAVAGHTDNVGGDGANLTLSQNRAKAVVDYITTHGIAADRLTSAGFGKTRPITPNTTDEGRQTNRRVEFTIVAK